MKNTIHFHLYGFYLQGNIISNFNIFLNSYSWAKINLKHVVAFVEDGSAAGKIGPFFQSLFQAIIFFPLSQVSYDVMYLHVLSKQGAIIKIPNEAHF